ncbi:MAG: sulfur carrier protein [Pseudonocardiales bacterium]|nr:sulfur carrier protein [Pseudonocardiales bacterium]
MHLIVNGQQRQVEDDISLTELVNQVSDRDTGIAVAVNNEVVPRSGWPAMPLDDGDRIDVVTAVQGG